MDTRIAVEWIARPNGNEAAAAERALSAALTELAGCGDYMQEMLQHRREIDEAVKAARPSRWPAAEKAANAALAGEARCRLIGFKSRADWEIAHDDKIRSTLHDARLTEREYGGIEIFELAHLQAHLEAGADGIVRAKVLGMDDTYLEIELADNLSDAAARSEVERARRHCRTALCRIAEGVIADIDRKDRREGRI